MHDLCYRYNYRPGPLQTHLADDCFDRLLGPLHSLFNALDGPVGSNGINSLQCQRSEEGLLGSLHCLLDSLDGPADALAVAGEGHVGSVAIHHRVGEDVGAVDRRALAPVDGDRIAVGDAVVLARVEGHPATVVEAGDEAVGLDALEGREGAVLDAGGLALGAAEVGHLAALVVVLEEDETVAGGVVGIGDGDVARPTNRRDRGADAGVRRAATLRSRSATCRQLSDSSPPPGPRPAKASASFSASTTKIRSPLWTAARISGSRYRNRSTSRRFQIQRPLPVWDPACESLRLLLYHLESSASRPLGEVASSRGARASGGSSLGCNIAG